MSGKPRVLVLTPWFLPGEQGGGSVLAVRYVVEQLASDFDFVVATNDHDLADTTPYAPAARDAARARLGIDIRYLPQKGRWSALRSLLAEGFDLIYLNSFLSRGFALMPLLARRLLPAPRPAVLLAPRGELMAGALQHKRQRKRAYLRLLMASGLLRDVNFHATSADEARELHQLGLGHASLAPDLPPRFPLPPPPVRSAGNDEPLRVVFAARIDPKKNLRAAIAALARVQLPLQFDVIGPIGDEAYWADCRPLLAALPAHVQTRYLGAMPHAELMQALTRYELLFMPTLAENHGYIILEALLAGCALLISDRTPWRGLAERGIGWDIPLHDEQAMADAVTAMARMVPAERLGMRQRAQDWGLTRLDGQLERDATRDLLRRQLAARPPA